MNTGKLLCYIILTSLLFMTVQHLQSCTYKDRLYLLRDSVQSMSYRHQSPVPPGLYMHTSRAAKTMSLSRINLPDKFFVDIILLWMCLCVCDILKPIYTVISEILKDHMTYPK